ncbi:hypothetical protein [Pseudonocardia sp. HH130630-07]|uniref:hypothetical protein n=1 Tax=Pseudonocardia sp. HH130630-07 TaxID=1690815 RepID=UPI00081533AD|nr:hypothetical protein [Pseudonocardia sp. HH130630-07]ANY07887.1 hypothetical protein AFB00_18055 [Pseudonocardia sp. HH130630-07]
MPTTHSATSPTEVDLPTPWADRTGRLLLAVCALATLGAFADGINRILAAPDEYALTEFWRTTAYLVFAGLWAMLALRPRGQRGVWELVLLQKGLVTAHALLNLDLPYAVRSAWIDGLLVVATVAAFVLCRGWLTWRPGAAGAPVHRPAALDR